MNFTINGRTALIAAASLWMCAALPMHVTAAVAQEAAAAEPAAAEAAPEAPAGKPIALTKFTRHNAARKKVAAGSHAGKVKAAKAKSVDAAPDVAAAAVADSGAKPALPASVANANAQLPHDAAPDPFAQATPVATSPLQPDALLKSVGAEPRQDAIAAPDPAAAVVAADELNDIDRAATEARPALTLASATIDPPATAIPTDTSGQASVQSASQDSTWDKTSLIGKIFIAFGGLLTMASAARMFMA